MGKRKAKKVVVKKAGPPKLETIFGCPFCNAEKSVECKIDREKQIGTIACNVCAADFQVLTNNLTEPIDIYSDWIDACDAENDAAFRAIQSEQQAAEEAAAAEEQPLNLAGTDGTEQGEQGEERETEPVSNNQHAPDTSIAVGDE